MRVVLGFFLILLLSIGAGLKPIPAGAEPDEPQISAEAAALIDVSSGRILYEKQADKRMRIASITKIMTAIIAIEHGDLEAKVTVSSQAQGVEGSSIYLKAGEKIPLEHLLYGLMLRSGNDAAVAIAEHIGGSLEGFVYLMNEKAAYLGLERTQFANPHGLDDDEHYSTAADFATLTAYAMKNPTFREIASAQVKTVPWPGEEWHRKWYNKNKMLRIYPGADGVKTGFTKRSGRTLVSSATRNGQQLATVTLNASDDWNDSMHLLNYGYRHYPQTEVVKKGEAVDSVTTSEGKRLAVVTSENFFYPLTEEEKQKLKVEPLFTYPTGAIDRDGQRVGTLRILLEEEPIGTVSLVTEKMEESSVLEEWITVLVHVMGRE